MTKEQAIEVIKAYRDKLTNSASNQLDGDIEAFEMAIQALEKENIYDDKEHYVTISKALYDKLNIDYEQALSAEPCIYDLKNRYCPRLNEHEMLKYPLQEPTDKPMTVDEMEREYEKSKALFHKIVECEDAISRPAVKELIKS